MKDDSWAEVCANTAEEAVRRVYNGVPESYAVRIIHDDMRHTHTDRSMAVCNAAYYVKRNQDYYGCRRRAARGFTAGYDPVRLPS